MLLRLNHLGLAIARAVSTAPPAPPALDGGGVAWHPLDEDADPLDDGTLVEAEIDRRAALEAAAALVEETSRSAKFDGGGGGGGGGGTSAASVLDPGASLAGEA